MNKKKSTPDDSLSMDTLAQTEHFLVWKDEDDGETIYHVELDVLTLHFFAEEWEELITLIKDAEFARREAK